jgi:sec-independent protein translocase protein TatA
MHLLANILGMFPEQWVLIAIVALLLFGKRLPEVGRSLGKGIISTQNSLKPGMQQPTLPSPSATAGFKFDPYTGKPVNEPAAAPMRFDPYTGKPLSEQPSQTTSSNT